MESSIPKRGVAYVATVTIDGREKHELLSFDAESIQRAVLSVVAAYMTDADGPLRPSLQLAEMTADLEDFTSEEMSIDVAIERGELSADPADGWRYRATITPSQRAEEIFRDLPALELGNGVGYMFVHREDAEACAAEIKRLIGADAAMNLSDWDVDTFAPFDGDGPWDAVVTREGDR
jgi:hypothetical protein